MTKNMLANILIRENVEMTEMIRVLPKLATYEVRRIIEKSKENKWGKKAFPQSGKKLAVGKLGEKLTSARPHQCQRH